MNPIIPSCLRALPLATAAAGLCLATASAETPVFEIGVFDDNTAEFEMESDSFNNPQYYYAPGDYSEITGGSGLGTVFEGPESEILQDGPTDAEWPGTLDGFPRAMVPGRPVVDVFFQLTPAQAASSALLFETKLVGLGGNSSHDIAFYLNNVAISRILRVRGDTPVKLYIPSNIPGMAFQEGGNVLTIRRTGGGPDNPWIQFDALKLTANVTAPTEIIWQVGTFDNNQADFEPEFNDHNNPQFYAIPGDYSGIRGAAGPGGDFVGPDAEIWKDPDDAGTGSLDGFPRALSPGRPAVDIYFKLTAAQAQRKFLALHTVLFSQGANSSHDVRAYLNGVPVAIGNGITQDLQVDVLIPRLDAVSQGYGAPFYEGANVLSLVRTGGGPVEPEGGDNPWIQLDAVSLTTAETPSDVSGLRAYRTVFSAGDFNNSTAEFEAESGAWNNPQFYFASGDYTGVEGGAGPGGVWDGPGGEIWQDGPTDAEWPATLDGFPRALVPSLPNIDLYFQAGSADETDAVMFTTKLWGLGGDSSHDLEFSINGKVFYTGTEITRETYVTSVIPAADVLPGANVITLKRTGGLETNPWIQFDQVELVSQAKNLSLPPVGAPAFNLTSVTRNAEGHVALGWDSVAGGVYKVQASSTLAADSWTDVSAALNASGAVTSYTDTAVPAAATVRFYRVVRTQ